MTCENHKRSVWTGRDRGDTSMNKRAVLEFYPFQKFQHCLTSVDWDRVAILLGALLEHHGLSILEYAA